MARQQFSENWGELEATWGENSTGPVKFNRLAHTNVGELLAVSLITEQIRVKQLRAALALNAGVSSKMNVFVSDCKTREDGADEWTARTPGKLHVSSEGYFVHNHKLGHGLAHCVLVTRTPGFMMIVNEETLWQELNTSRFTTPLLREWVPYLANQLRQIGRLRNALTYNCQCGVLSVSTRKLDEIVVQGLVSGEITISSTAAASAA
jgi:hypothetical protein